MYNLFLSTFILYKYILSHYWCAYLRWSDFNSLSAKLINWNFHPLEVVSRWCELYLADAINNFKSVNIIQIWQSVVKDFETLLIDVSFYL